MENAKIDIRSIPMTALVEWLEANKEPKFRAKQVQEWLWKKSANSFDEMTNLSISLREKLKEAFVFHTLCIDKQQVSTDGTIKSRWKLHDGHFIESVIIPVPADNRYTVCVSSQVGCSLTCSFCATGRMARVRNLDMAEIYDQVAIANRQCMETYGHPLTNIVYMGMGEPLLAYRPVMDSIDKITSPDGLGMAARRITVSTAGIAKMIKKLADDEVRFNLAISLHAADDVKRNEIMPINESNNLEVLVEALQYFHTKTDNPITFEYIAFEGFNDSLEDAKNLVKLCQKVPAKVNIIEYNAIDDAPFEKASMNKVDAFAQYLRKYHIACTVRRSRGRDIDAACGQLANKG